MAALFAEVFINQETHTGVIVYDKDDFGHNFIVYGDSKLVNRESDGKEYASCLLVLSVHDEKRIE